MLRKVCKPEDTQSVAMGSLSFLMHPVAKRDGTLRHFLSQTDAGLLALAGDHEWLVAIRDAVARTPRPVILTSEAQIIAFRHINCRPCHDTDPLPDDVRRLDMTVLPPLSECRQLRLERDADSVVPRLPLGVLQQAILVESLLDKALGRALEMLQNEAAVLHYAYLDDKSIVVRGKIYRSMAKTSVNVGVLLAFNKDRIVERVVRVCCDELCTAYESLCCT
jgi:hypothetical protein